MAFLLPMLLRLWPYVLLAVFTVFVAYKANHWCNTVCKDARAEVSAMTAQITAAKQRATDIALLWAAQVTKAEEAAHAKEQENAARFAALKDDARRAAGANPARFSAGAIRVFDDSRDAASAGPAAVAVEAAPAPSGSAEVFVVEMYEWAAVCRARVDEWQAFYKGLQNESR